ncbi:hypothetical protein MDG893_04227 [Marinobacter algicola DG893]|uniref:Uncharacterized protein n=1 Tax=Marinobacter algicola DG893 TaxID=443152 RepID=A6EYN2_9GAMM|nr:hypothetical protein MDG893_04227 [Marinobacter algicola DG893]
MQRLLLGKRERKLEISPLQYLLKTSIREPLSVEPIKSPANLEKAGEGEKIVADQT